MILYLNYNKATFEWLTIQTNKLKENERTLKMKQKLAQHIGVESKVQTNTRNKKIDMR